MMDRDEVKLLLRRAEELEQRAAATVAVGDFLTPSEQMTVAGAYPRCRFWGGYRGAERRAPLFLPDWMEEYIASESYFTQGSETEADAQTDEDLTSQYDAHSTQGSGTKANAQTDEDLSSQYDARSTQGSETKADAQTDVCLKSPFGADEDKREASVERLIADGTDGGSVDDAIAVLELRCSDFVTLTHRDWMGSVLALGLERRCIGDICVTSKHSALMFVHRRIGGYIAENLHRAGRDAVSAKLAARDSVSVPPREFESITVTVASPRLDGVVKALCGLSRESAADLIRRGEVQVNYTAEERCDRAVSPSDVVCVRGAGKYIVDAYEGENRRGRLRLAVRRYV